MSKYEYLFFFSVSSLEILYIYDVIDYKFKENRNNN